MKTDLPARKKPYSSLQRKMWLALVFIYLPISIFSFLGYYNYARRSALSLLTRHLAATASEAASSLDAGNFQQLYQEERASNPACQTGAGGSYPEDDPRFQAHMHWLEGLIHTHPGYVIRTYVRGEGAGEVVFIGSSDYFNQPPRGFKFCQSYQAGIDSPMVEGLSRRVDIWEAYQDERGSWISTFLPVAGGAIEISLPADEILRLPSRLLGMASLAFVLTFLTLLLIILRLTDTVFIPIQDLAAITAVVGREGPRKAFAEIKRRGIHRDEVDTLIESTQAMLERIDSQTGELLQSRRLMQDLAQATLRAQEKERRLVSRELHDDTGHRLLNLGNTLASLLADLESRPAPEALALLRSGLQDALHQSDQVLKSIRELSHQMRPSLLDAGDINLAFRELCDEFQKNRPIKVGFEGGLAMNPPEEISISLYRFLQEALTNVGKHAAAGEARVLVEARDGMIRISVSDNGRGAAAVAERGDGIGLAGMRERFLLLGGTVETRSGPDGFTVTAQVPADPGPAH